MPSRLVVGVVAVVLASSSPTHATTYYVNPQSGADTNVGSTAASPWRTVPGTRTTNNSGFLRSSWGGGATSGGAISSTNRVKCGDTILLRGGTTHSTSTVPNGGPLRIDPTFYSSSCNQSAPITVTVATDAEWSGSSGHFTMDVAGMDATSTVQGNGPCPSGGFCGFVNVERVSSVVFGGRDSSRKWVIQNVTVDRTGDESGIVVWGSDGDIRFIEGRWFLVRNRNLPPGQGAGLDVGGLTDSWFHDVEIEDWRGPGADAGLTIGWVARNVGFERVTVRRGGPTDPNGPNQPSDCFQLLGAQWNSSQPGGGGFWCISCHCEDHYWNGTNSGGSNLAGTDQLVRYRDFRCLGCGRTAAQSSAGAGFESAGDNNCSGAEGTVIVTKSILYKNRNTGIDGPHGGGVAVYMNNTLLRAGENVASITYDRSACNTTAMNNIVRGATTPWVADFGGSQEDVKLVSNHNLYDFWSSASEQFASFRFSGNSFSYANIPFSTAASQSGFTGANDKISTSSQRFDPDWNTVGGNCSAPWSSGNGAAHFATCDLNLRSSSPAVDGGTFFLRANGSGSGTTINVRANGQVGVHTADPRAYFRQPGSYWKSPGDDIMIQRSGGGVCTGRIVSMTSTSITIDTPCSGWGDGAGVHLPWSGSAPDMGAFEVGLPGASAPAPPTLLSVDPIP